MFGKEHREICRGRGAGSPWRHHARLVAFPNPLLTACVPDASSSLMLCSTNLWSLNLHLLTNKNTTLPLNKKISNIQLRVHATTLLKHVWCEIPVNFLAPRCGRWWGSTFVAAGVVRFQKKKEIWLGLSSALNSTILLDLRRTSRRVIILVVFSHPNKALKFFSSKLYKIRIRSF